MSKHMSDKKSHIEPVKTQVPTSIRPVTPDKQIITKPLPERRNYAIEKKAALQDIKEQETTTKKGIRIMENLRRKAGQKVTEWLLMLAMFAFRKIRDILLETVLSFGVYVKDADGNPVQKVDEKGNPVTDAKGNPVYKIAWLSTLIAVLVKNRAEFGFIAALLGNEVFGVSILEWLQRIAGILGM